MSDESLKVAMIGSGVAGPVLALSLIRLRAKRTNIRLEVLLFDAAKDFKAVGAAFGLTPNALRPLRQLGLMRKLLERGEITTGMCNYDAASKAEVMKVRIPPNMAGEPLIFLERAVLQEIVRDELLAVGVHIQLSKKLLEVTEQPDGKCEVVFTDATRETDIDVVVGADGVRSRVRDFVLGGNDNMPYFNGVCGLVGITGPIPSMKEEDKGTSYAIIPTAGPGGYGISTWALPDNRQFWTYHQGDTHNPAGPGHPIPRYTAADLEEARKKLYDLWHPFGTAGSLADCTPPDRMVMIPTVSRVYPRITSKSGNAVLVGDAAHPMGPYIGQGANMAIEDAIVLANALLPPEGETRGVHWYEAHRRDRVASVVKTNELVGKVYMGRTLFWRTMRWLTFALMKWMVPKPGQGGGGGGDGGGPMAWIHQERILLELE